MKSILRYGQCFIDGAFVFLGAHLVQNAFRHHGEVFVWAALECMWLIEWGISRHQAAQKDAAEDAQERAEEIERCRRVVSADIQTRYR
jgi:hypothetical protein